MVKSHTVINVPQARMKGRTRTASQSLRGTVALQGATADQAIASFKEKMLKARKASIKNGSYVLPALTAAEAAVLIKSSPLLAYLKPNAKSKKTSSSN